MTTDLGLKRLHTVSEQLSANLILAFNVTIHNPHPTWFPLDRRNAVLSLLLTLGLKPVVSCLVTFLTVDDLLSHTQYTSTKKPFCLSQVWYPKG